jgi:hypothetical protein
VTGGRSGVTPVDRWAARRRAVLPLLAVMLVALLALFEREWRRGEVFSPADLVFQFYPWARQTSRVAAANPTRSDEAFYHQPLMTSHFTRLREGEFPDYDDTRLSGAPAFFDGFDVGRAFSPFSLPFYLLPAEDAVNWYGPLRLLVAAFAMWLFLRELGVGAVAAAGAGVAYGLNGHFLTWLSAPMPTVAAWLPLVLRQVRRCARHGEWPDVAGLALATGALLLGTYLPTTFVCLFAAAVYGAIELWLAGRPGALDGRARSPNAAHSMAGLGEPALPTHASRRPGASGERRYVHGALALALGGLLGLGVGAVALWPMLAGLRGSPASARVVSAEGAVWANVATLAMPDFWGTPVLGNWWHPDASANYPEHVAYFGLVVVLLASLSLAGRLSRELSVARWTFVGLTALALTRAYGVAPGRWLVWLPGQAQSNPFRWYVLAGCGFAVLAGLGLHAWLTEADRRHRLRTLVGPLVIALTLAGVVAAALFVFLPDVRARNLQAFERGQIQGAAVVAALTALLMVVTAWLSDQRQRMAGGLLLVALAAADLVQAHRGLNPTLPRDRYYPVTASLDWLREQGSETRLAPVDTTADLIQGHVWSIYGLSAVTGFDFHGDTNYQHYMRLAQEPAGVDVAKRPATWSYVGLHRDTLDLRMLGVLGVRYIVAPPVDVTPRAGGYAPIGPMVDGRTIRFTVPVRHDGVHGMDLLAATYARQNRGRWHWQVAGADSRVLAEGSVEQSALRDNEWWRLAWPPVERSAGSTLTLTLRSEGSDAGSSATLLATATASALGTTLRIDDEIDRRTLWFRTFSTAADRFGEAALVRAGDLNIYRNPHARPRAWFVQRAAVADASTHASAMHAGPFDPAKEAWLAASPPHRASSTARVTSISLDDDRRTIGVEAPDGGVLVVGERAHPGWAVAIDGRAVPWQVADAVLIGVAVPPGSRTITLEFRQPAVRPAAGLTLLSLAGIAFAYVLRVRRTRSAAALEA